MINRRSLLLLPLAGIALAGCANTNNTKEISAEEAENIVKPTGTKTLDNVYYEITEQFLAMGPQDAAHKIRIYEDMQCPYCKELLTSVHQELADKVKEGVLRLEIVPVNYLGVRSTNGWSENAANVLAVISETQPDKFMDVQQALFDKQPEERSTEVISPATIRSYIKDVVELSADEVKSIDNGKYVDWVNNIVTPFAASNDISKIPTVVVNDVVLEDYKTITDELAKI